MPTFTVVVFDASSPQTPVPGASVYLDGRSVGQTNSAGVCIMRLPDAQDHTITADSPVFNTGTLATQGATSANMFLTPVPSNLLPTTVQVLDGGGSPVPQASVQISDSAGNQVDSLFTDAYGNATTTAGLRIGSNYSYSVSAAGFQSFSSSSTIDGSFQVSLGPLVATDDPESNSLPPASPPDESSLILSSAETISVDSPGLDPVEYIYPDSVDGKYFTASQLRLYVGNVFIDELNGVQFVLQDNKVPIYPYNSRYFSAVGQGRALIQGQLMINFISEGYLYTILREYRDKVLQNSLTPDQQRQQQMQLELNNLLLRRQQAQTALALPGSPATTQAVNLVPVNQRITELMNTLGPDGADVAKQNLTKIQLTRFDDPSQFYTNALSLSGPFDLRGELTAGGRTVVRALEKCFLISNEQVYGQDGAPILDVYGFIARRLR